MATISISTTPIAVKTGTGRKAKPNDFLPVIAQFDDGQTRSVVTGAGEKTSTLLMQVRTAAKTINRSVTVELVGGTTATTATGFKFMLRSQITRTRKGTAPATPATAEAPTKGAKAKKG